MSTSGKCLPEPKLHWNTKHVSFLMNETLWNAMNKASSLDLINQIDP